MDLVFWLPWAVGSVIFILWIKHPIVEFRQMFKEKQDEENKVSINSEQE